MGKSKAGGGRRGTGLVVQGDGRGDQEAGRDVRVVEVRWYAVAQQGRVING